MDVCRRKTGDKRYGIRLCCFLIFLYFFFFARYFRVKAKNWSKVHYFCAFHANKVLFGNKKGALVLAVGISELWAEQTQFQNLAQIKFQSMMSLYVLSNYCNRLADTITIMQMGVLISQSIDLSLCLVTFFQIVWQTVDESGHAPS